MTFSLGDYGHLDHGYAATVHKGQGVTVDHAHVLASSYMDRHAAYVGLTRHRSGVSLHYGRDEFADAGALARVLGRERAKDTTLDYGEGVEDLVAAYAARRELDCLPPLGKAVEAGAAPVQRKGRFAGLRLNAECPLAEASRPPPAVAAPEAGSEPGHTSESSPAGQAAMEAEEVLGKQRALEERGRALVQAWGQLELAYEAEGKRHEWADQREVGTRLEALAKELKGDLQLDDLLRRSGRDLGVEAGSRLDRIVQAQEVDQWLLRRIDIEHGPKGHFGPSRGM